MATHEAAEFHFLSFDIGQSWIMWPSGHTGASFAVAATLHAYYPHCKWVPWIAYPCALFIGLTMLDGKFHWASDVLAGSLIAIPIGTSIGQCFGKHPAIA
jgi:membrane-associated phospholipid phosphatase